MWTIIKTARKEIAYYRALITHTQTPKIPRWLLGIAIAYFLSPIDLIPDAIPILGQLDDLVIVTILVCGALALIPNNVKVECSHEIAQRNL